MLDLMMEEYGTSSWRDTKVNTSPLPPMDEKIYWQTVRSMLISAYKAEYMEKDGYLRLCIPQGTYDLEVPKDLVKAFFNRKKPTWVVENILYILEEWNRVNGRPENLKSSYNFICEDFARLYIAFNGNIPKPFKEKIELYLRGKTALILLKKSKAAARWAIKTNLDLYPIKIGDVYRLFRAGPKVWAVCGLFETLPVIAERSLDWELINKITWRDGTWEVKDNKDLFELGPRMKTGVINNSFDRFEKALGIKDVDYDTICSACKWMKEQGFIPKTSALLFESPSSLVNKKVYAKAFKRFSSTIIGEYNQVSSALFIQRFFSASNWSQFLDYMNRRGINDHDVCARLTGFVEPMEEPKKEEQIGAYLMKNKDASLENLSFILKRFSELTEKHLRMKLGDLVSTLHAKAYLNVENEALAKECAKFGYNGYSFSSIQREIKKAEEKLTSESVPAVEAEFNGYKMYRLLKNDPRGLFLGDYTNCCQKPGGAGETCAWHGVASEDGAFYVVEDKTGKIVAQSWTWRDGDIIVFDNIECLGSLKDRKETLKQLYTDVANKIIGILAVKQVNVGMGYDDSDGMLDAFNTAIGPYRAKTPKGCYTDAGNQKIIAKDHTIELTPMDEFVL